MRNLKKIVEIILIIVITIWAVSNLIEWPDNIDQEVAAIELNFVTAAKRLNAQLENNGQVKIIGPKKYENIRGVVQREWIIVSSIADTNEQGSFYAFKIIRQPYGVAPLTKWLAFPGFWHNGSFSGFPDYYIDIFEDQLLDPEILETGYYRNYHEEPFYSTFLLLQNFVKQQNKK